MNWLAIIVGTIAFWLVGALWYGLLFARPWQRLAGSSGALAPAGVVGIVALTLLLELLVVMTLGHLFARILPNDRAAMMIAIGFGLTIMTPAIGINYLHQRRPLALFLIDAGHFVVGMAAVGAVFVLLT
jgi:predicted permease